MEKECKKCQILFKITDDDLKFYDKISPVFQGKKYQIPSPTLCPECRQQKRLAWRNERHFYNRTCNNCQSNVISIYSPLSAQIVLCVDCWWKEENDARKYNMAFDFNKSFIDQFQTLYKNVPVLANNVWKSENCDFNNFCVNCKDCYLSFRLMESEQVYFSYLSIKSTQCFDCHTVKNSQYCYECIDCDTAYTSYWCRQCKNISNCIECFDCKDCKGCKNCFGCIGLRNKEYCFFNDQLSENEYKAQIKKYKLGSHNFRIKMKNEAYQHFLKYAYKSLIISQSENATGNYINNSQNIKDSFDIEQTTNANNAWEIEFGNEMYDSNYAFQGQYCLENMGNTQSSYILFSNFISGNNNSLTYCISCTNNSSNCFGCIGLKHKQYCILNKQYSKEEYESLVPKIIDKMISDGEWGEFFPSALSPFGYNETVASEYFPLNKQEALSFGFNWSDYQSPPPTVSKIIPAHLLPDSIHDIPDDILNWAIECEVTKKPFRIIKQELQFYRDHNLPIPRKHPDQRHKERMQLRNPRKLFSRNCMKCTKEIQTTYSPDRPEIIYCEDCYLKEVY